MHKKYRSKEDISAIRYTEDNINEVIKFLEVFNCRFEVQTYHKPLGGEIRNLKIWNRNNIPILVSKGDYVVWNSGYFAVSADSFESYYEEIKELKIAEPTEEEKLTMLFRIWNNETKRYIHPEIDVDYFVNAHGRILCINQGESYFMYGCTIELCSDVKDMDGKYIFVGDIVTVDDPNAEDGEETVCIVDFVDGALKVEPIHTYGDFIADDVLRVIGNIHENEDLLLEKD